MGFIGIGYWFCGDLFGFGWVLWCLVGKLLGLVRFWWGVWWGFVGLVALGCVWLGDFMARNWGTLKHEKFWSFHGVKLGQL